MERKLIKKMILNCFKQYYESGAIPLNDKEMEELIGEVLKIKEDEPAADLYEVVNDRVYDFLSN